MKNKILRKFDDKEIAINVRNREECDNLMEFLEKHGFKWERDVSPTSIDVFQNCGRNTCISICDGTLIHGDIQVCALSNYKIISYQDFMEMLGEINGLDIEKLTDTIELMISTDYKERFKAEYYQTKIRYDKLHKMIIKYEAGTVDLILDSPINVLKEQANAMGKYLCWLEVRAELEDIDLT